MLRPYQKKAFEIIVESIKHNPRALFQGATGCGKTALACTIVEHFRNTYPKLRFLILTNKGELLTQFNSSFNKFTNVTMFDIGFCSAGIQSKKQTNRKVTLATVQTLVNQLNDCEPFDLIIVDETHRTGFEDNGSQYDTVLTTLMQYNPKVRIIGLTATAYRLGHGYIYGDKCRKGRTNFFPKLTHRVTYNELKDLGYLMPLRALAASKPDLSSISVKGDYVLSQAGSVMVQHVSSILEAYKLHANHHKKVAILACTIEHAEKIQEELLSSGYKSVLIHSKKTKAENQASMINWEREENIIFSVSVNMLTEGIDLPWLSCLITARPTKSPVVYIQAVGRILRIAKNKNEALLIDMAGWVEEFGSDLDNPVFKIPDYEGDGETPVKVCPGNTSHGYACGNLVHPATRICPECGYEWTVEEVEAELPELKEVFFEPEPAEWHDVTYMYIGRHDKGDKSLMRIQIECGSIKANEWLCFPDYYQGLAVEKGYEKWMNYSDEEYPQDIETAIWHQDTIKQPLKLKLQKDGKYYNIIDTQFEEIKKHDMGDLPF